MFKFLVIVIAFVAPFIHSTKYVYDDDVKKQMVEGKFVNEFRQKCKDVSGVDVDVERNDRLYEEYKKCAKDALDINEFGDELRNIFMIIIPEYKANFTIADQQKSSLVLVSQKFCPKISTYLNCEDVLSPIYTKCYTAQDVRNVKVANDALARLSDFFCKENAQGVRNFTAGNVMEFVFEKQLELFPCYKDFIDGMLPNGGIFCSSIDTLRNCILPIVERCESLVTSTLVNSLFDYVKKNGICGS